MWKWAAGVGAVALIGFALWLGITRYGAAFQKLRLRSSFVTFAGVQAPGRDPATPHAQRSGLGMHEV